MGGKETSEAAKLAAKEEFYESIGMHALMVKRGILGHISDRLQEAMWREILHSLNDDIATTGELDESIVYSPGLRWAIMGMNQIYMLGGGKGVRAIYEAIRPRARSALDAAKAPELTDEIIDRFADGTEAQAEGKSIPGIEAIQRDECMVAIQRVLAKYDMGSGKALNKFEARLAAKAKGGLVASFEPEQAAEASPTFKVCGVDEVGRGPLAGPGIAAAVYIPLTLWKAEEMPACAIQSACP